MQFGVIRPGAADGVGAGMAAPVNILIVDDEPRNLAVLESVLDDPEYRLVRANSGDEALLALMAEDFAVLVLDVRMPGMTGFELAQMIKERKKTARIPIIFLTAYYNEDQHILEGYGTGAVDYLHKPVNPAILKSKVAMFADLYKKGRELERANQLLVAEVAERRRAEARLNEVNESLDRRVTERTTELQISESRLMEANRRKDEFLATLAHELRNPLAPVRNAAQILRMKNLPSDKVEWAAELVERQVAAMSRMIDDLMDVSRINQGRIQLRRAVIDLTAVLADALETAQPLIREQDHRIVYTPPVQPVLVDADQARLAQVFMNLLNNAAKYMDRGGEISIGVHVDADRVLVTIKDSGIGIPAHRLESIFEMFSQEEAALARSRGGLGIGLSLTQRLIQMHDGKIVARSEGPGRGSEFEVCLPIAEVQQAAPTERPASSLASAGCELRILVADDNRDAADTLCTLLEVLGHEVHRVHDGQAAVDAAASFNPQLVLLDIGMPQLNGYDACRHIRVQPGGNTRTVVAITGWGQPEDLRRSRDAGFDHHLVKPIDMDKLADVISRSFARG
ncbi:MAG: putative histidine kinase, atypical hybrid [Ramlibacter sp.]|nr:putative histidine kinase, atypical hybrid [Ramlibacter sp.]